MLDYGAGFFPESSGAGENSSPASPSLVGAAKAQEKIYVSKTSADAPYFDRAIQEAQEDDLLGIKRDGDWVNKRARKLWSEDYIRVAKNGEKLQWLHVDEVGKIVSEAVTEAVTEDRKRNMKILTISESEIKERLEREYSKQRIIELNVSFRNSVIFLASSIMIVGAVLLPEFWRPLVLVCPLALALFVIRNTRRVKHEVDFEQQKEREREERGQLREMFLAQQKNPIGSGGFTGVVGPTGVTGCAPPRISATGPTQPTCPEVQVGDGLTQLSYGPNGEEEGKEPVSEPIWNRTREELVEEIEKHSICSDPDGLLAGMGYHGSKSLTLIQRLKFWITRTPKNAVLHDRLHHP